MRNILLATDGSDCAEEAAAFLARLPRIEKLNLTVLTVIDIPYVNDGFLSSEWLVEATEHEKAIAAEAFKNVEKLFDGTEVAFQRIVREGARAETIVEVAKTLQADLVVLGARGHSTVTRLLLGSTSDYVATHAQCSVLVVRPGDGRPTSEALRGASTARRPLEVRTPLEVRRPLKIAIGYQGTRTAELAIEEIAEVNWGRGAEFHVVSVVSYLAGLFEGREMDFVAIRNAATKAAEKAAGQLQKRVPLTQAHTVENPHPGEGLVKFAEDQQCDLVVVGETPRSLFGRFLLGSVSRFVLRHAPCSVWIARNRASQEAEEDEDEVESRIVAT